MNISDDAKKMLRKAASDDADRNLMRVSTLGGLLIHALPYVFADGNDHRESMRWDEALSELENNGLIRPLSAKRQVFEVTHRGYQVADGE